MVGVIGGLDCRWGSKDQAYGKSREIIDNKALKGIKEEAATVVILVVVTVVCC
jgi:hypothetical protein